MINTVYRIAAAAVVLSALLGLGSLYIEGIAVRTTPDAFVANVGMPLFEVKDGQMNVRLAPSPAAWPEEKASMYGAAYFRIPVHVRLQSKEANVIFDIAGLSKEGEFLIPCRSETACRLILYAAQISAPEHLTRGD